MEITFIGAGNVAWHLAQALDDAGHIVQEVYSRHLESASLLADKLYRAVATQSLNFSKSKAQVFIISLPDSVVTSIVAQVLLPENAILVHTSGTLPLESLSGDKATGVFYPLQTFSKHTPVKIAEVPFCIEATDEATEDILVSIAQSISQTVYLVNSAERKVLHIAAVFACNFTNHLLAIAHQITSQQGLEFSLLSPLIKETIHKALQVENPASVQTGPAIRQDTTTIQTHLHYLSSYASEQKIYELLTESIIEKSGISKRNR